MCTAPPHPFRTLTSSTALAQIVATLLGSDGGVGHAVTVRQGIIWDSTQDFAMRLTLNALDFCVGSKFKGVHHSFLLRPLKKLLNSKRRQERDRIAAVGCSDI